ncbi:transcriptional regulator [Mycobacterium tuberculosis]|nr:transcriptional regulator [Mycobacterium tuberculosis]
MKCGHSGSGSCARLSHSPRSRWLRWRTSGRAGVSSIENGDIGSAQVNTLRKYVSALGGELDITVRLGDETFTLA